MTKKLLSNISRAVNSNVARFNIIYIKKENNLLNKIMNIKEKNQSLKTVIQFFRNISSSRIIFNLFNSS